MSVIVVENQDKVLINSNSTLILRNDICNIEYCFDNDSKVLVFADFNGDLVLNESGKVSNCEVSISYLQLDNYSLIQNTSIDISYNGHLNINSTYLGVKNKNVTYNLVNIESNSEVNITNNVVCLDDSDFVLNCVGTITKGSKRSKCFQKNRCLTIDDPKKAKILPVLNIDENDVEAAHSLSSGTIDEEVLFYMNSRGLNKKESLNLILKSYLMPNDSFYEDYTDGKDIQEQAVKKVDLLCLM